MAIQITQATGVGAALVDKGLSGAWLVAAVTVALPASQYAYETTLLDASDGLTVVLTAASTALPSFAPSVGKGSFRFRTRYRATSTAAWVTWYRVVRVQRDADGSNLEGVAPALDEVPSETAESRGYATIFDEVVRNSVAATSVTAALPLGAAQVLPDANTTLTSARRALQATLTTPLVLTTLQVRTQVIPAGTVVGERRVIGNDVKDSMMRLRFTNPDGSHVAWINGPQRIEVEWGDVSRWHPLSPERRAKVFYPEDFGAGVGVGDITLDGAGKTADTRALEALALAIYNSDASGQASGEQSCEVLFTAPEYHVSKPLLFRGTDYTSVRFRGSVPGEYGGFKGNRIQWVGATAAKMTGTPTMTFNRAARTIVRSAGSWITDGFTTGMRVYCGRPANQNTGANVRIFDTITVTDATTLTVTSTGVTEMMPFDEVAASGYQIVEALTALRFLCSGFTVQDLAVFCQTESLCFAFHVDIGPHLTDLTNTTDFKFLGCAAIGLIDHPLAALWAVGRPPSNGAVGSQCDTGRWRNVFGVGSLSYNRNHQGRGIAFLEGSNTKDFWIDDSMFWSVRRGIDHEKSSETIRITGMRFDDIGECCVYNNGFAEVSGCQAERVAAAILGSTGNLVEKNNSWNMRCPVDNVVLAQRQISAQGCQYINDRVYMTVTAINAGTDTWTANNNNENLRAPTNGDEVVVRAIGGDHSVPVGLDVDSSFWLASVAETGAGTNVYTFQLYKGGPSGGGGTLVDAISFAACYIMAPAVVVLNDQDKTGSTTDQSGASFDGCRFWGAEKYPHVRGSTASYYTFAAQRSYQFEAHTRAHVRNCYGIRPGPTYFALREISSVPRGYLGIAPTVGDFSSRREDVVYLGQGLQMDGWSTLEFDWKRLKDGSGQTDQYIVLPYRCGITGICTEVVPDGNGAVGFAGTALTAITVQCGVNDTALSFGGGFDPDGLLTVHNIFSTAFAANLSDRRWGFTSAERGVLLPLGGQYWQKITGATDNGWTGVPGSTNTLITLRWTLTGAAFSALTAGRLRVHVKLEQIPHWERT